MRYISSHGKLKNGGIKFMQNHWGFVCYGNMLSLSNKLTAAPLRGDGLRRCPTGRFAGRGTRRLKVGSWKLRLNQPGSQVRFRGKLGSKFTCLSKSKWGQN
jgi:hypothetical protein